MEDYIINVTGIEELQKISNIHALDKIFAKAKRNIIGGGKVVLVRTQADGTTYTFDELTNEMDLDVYKKQVYKYL